MTEPLGTGTGMPRWGPDGLVPVIVQDVADGRVLMLAYQDAEALAATLATGQVHLHSRSRGSLWRKGATSGNTLELVGLALDCDGDAILATVRPAGPTCHRGTRSCFDPGAGPDPATVIDPGPTQRFGVLAQLWQTIVARRLERPAGSYTARLLDGGVDAAGRKVVEEATEVLIAAKDDARRPPEIDSRTTRDPLAGEVADLLYHVLVLLAERNLEPRAVMDVLASRSTG